MPGLRVRRLLAIALVAVVVAACGSTIQSPTAGSSAPLPASATPTTANAPGTAPVTAPPPTPVGSSVDAAPCGPPDVAVAVNGLGATGSIFLVIRATNRGTAPCALVGPPQSISLRAGGGSLPITYAARPDPWPGDTPGLIAPPVVLAPGASATAKAVWMNFCLGPADVSTVWVGLGSDAIDAHPEPPIPAARCDNQSAGSTVEGYPFELDAPGD